MLDWCITFFVYDNKWYDKVAGVENASDIPKVGDEYISIGAQAKMLKSWIADVLSKNSNEEKVKIFFAEVIIDVDSSSVINIYETGSGTPTNLEVPVAQIPTAGTSQISLTYILEKTFGACDANRNALIAVGHGSVFGINLYNYLDDIKSSKLDFLSGIIQKLPTGLNEKQVQPFNIVKENLFSNFFSEKITFKKLLDIKNESGAPKFPKNVFGDITGAGLNIQLLTLNEIKNSIKGVFKPKNKKLDILVFDSCLMNNIFSHFELSECVDYFVASQSGITYPGLNYIAMLNKVFDDTNSNSESVSHLLVTKITEHPEYKNYKDFINTWSIKSQKLDARLLSKIGNSFSELVNLILNSNKTNRIIYKNILTNIIKNTFKYDIYSLQGQLSIRDLSVVFLELNKQMALIRGKVENFEQMETLLTNLLKTIEHYTSSGKAFISKKIFDFKGLEYLDKEYKDKLSFGIPLSTNTISSKTFNVFKNGKTPYRPKIIDQIMYKEFFDFLSK